MTRFGNRSEKIGTSLSSQHLQKALGLVIGAKLRVLPEGLIGWHPRGRIWQGTQAGVGSNTQGKSSIPPAPCEKPHRLKALRCATPLSEPANPRPPILERLCYKKTSSRGCCASLHRNEAEWQINLPRWTDGWYEVWLVSVKGEFLPLTRETLGPPSQSNSPERPPEMWRKLVTWAPPLRGRPERGPDQPEFGPPGDLEGWVEAAPTTSSGHRGHWCPLDGAELGERL